MLKTKQGQGLRLRYDDNMGQTIILLQQTVHLSIYGWENLDGKEEEYGKILKSRV